jgi:hypothetical protein
MERNCASTSMLNYFLLFLFVSPLDSLIVLGPIQHKQMILVHYGFALLAATLVNDRSFVVTAQN